MIKKVLFSSIFFSLTIFYSLAAYENNANGARSAGLGNASVTLSDVWSTGNNQAGLANIKNISAGIYYENSFLLKELSLKAATVSIPLKAGVFGISASTFGYKLYSENKYGIAFSKAFGSIFSAGVQMNYFNTKIAEGYGSTGAALAEMGIQAKLTKNLTLGSHLFNPAKTKLADYNNERIPTIMRLGIDYKFSEKVFVATEIQKDIINKPILKLGVEYNPRKEIYLRTGFSTNPATSTIGFGLLLKKLKFDFASSFDSVLGFTPHAGLTFELK